MTSTSTEQTKASADAPAAAAAEVSLPTVQMLTAIAAAGLIIGGVAYGLVSVIRPDGKPAAVTGAAVSVGALWLVLLGVAPWKRRSLAQWPFSILFGSVVSLALVLIGLILLYSATPLDGVTLALSIAATWFGGFFAEVMVYGRYVKAFDGIGTG